MPRVLARLPYGEDDQADRRVRLRGSAVERAARRRPMDHDHYCWMNAAYVHGHAADRRLRQVRLLHGHPRRRGRRQGRGPAGPHLHDRRRRPRREVPDRDRHHRPPRVRTVQPRLPAALPLQEHRLRGVLRRPDDAEAEEVRPPRGDRQRRDLGPAALHHGDLPVRPLPEGDGPRQDRLLHGSQRLRDLAQPLDQELRQRQRRRRARR